MKATSGAELAKKLRISPARGIEAVMKAQLISAVLKAVEANELTPTPEIDSSEITVKKPLFWARTWRAATNATKPRPSKRSISQGTASTMKQTTNAVPESAAPTRTI